MVIKIKYSLHLINNLHISWANTLKVYKQMQ